MKITGRIAEQKTLDTRLASTEAKLTMPITALVRWL